MAQNLEIVHVSFIPADGEPRPIFFDSVEYMYIIEDIYSFNITGKIAFYDREGIIEFGPMNGFEEFEITFGMSDASIDENGKGKYKTIKFKIFKVEKIEQVKESNILNATYVEILLVDEYFYKFNNDAWSKSWKDKKGSAIIKDIAQHHLGITDFNKFEPSKDDFKFFDTHLKTPNECISWLMDRSASSVADQPGYLFFRNGETDEFKYNLVSIETLLSDSKLMKPEGEGNVYGFFQQNQHYINAIRRYDVKHIDLNALRSLVGGSLMGFDIQRKKLLKRDYTYEDAIKRFTVLGNKTLFTEDMYTESPTKQIETIDNENVMDNLWYGNWIREYCNQQLVEITVDGHIDRYAGGIIRILWESFDRTKDVYNKQMDGKYLVKSITHWFSPHDTVGWRQKLVCIKNGYRDSDNNKLVKAKKVNS